MNDPCSTTSAPYVTASPTPAPATEKKLPAEAHAFTEDQARAQIEAKGYLRVSRLRKGAEGTWYGKAELDGVPVNVTLDFKGNVTSN